jgi:hypothetical protein
MPKFDVRGAKIKSFVMDSSYDWIVRDEDEEIGYALFRVDGFVLLEKGSFVNGDECDTAEDQVVPFSFDDMGFSLCQSFSNHIGIVKRGDPIPSWVLSQVARQNSK